MKKRKTEKPSNDKFENSMGSLNIEPPKIYRDEQRTKKANLNKTEIRRRQNKKRKLKNSVRKVIIAISLFTVLIAAGVVLSLTVFFKIDTFDVTGSGIYSSEEVLDNCNINYGDNLFLIKSDICKKKLEKNLPYIYNVNFKRKLPGTIVIDITDAKAEYFIENENKTSILLDDNFKVLDNASSEAPDSAIKITDSVINQSENGTEIVFENENISSCLKIISTAIKTTNMIEATAICSNDTDNNFIIYDNRITFALGSCENIEDKIYKGLASCEKLNDSAPNVKGILHLDDDKQIYFTEE